MGIIGKILKLSHTDYLYLLEAIFTSGVVRFVILFVPMKKFASYLGKRTNCKTENDLSLPLKALKIKNALIRASRVVPWRFMCYEQAFTGKIMLRRRNIKTKLYFGVRKDGADSITAHAWLEAGSRIVTGAFGHQSYQVIAVFE